MVNVPYLGRISFMRIGKRQLRQRGPRKRNKPFFVLKTTSIPSETPYILEQWYKFGKAAISARGGTMEDVIAAVRRGATGPTKPEAVKKAEREARWAAADANMARIEEKLRERGTEAYFGKYARLRE